MLYVEIDLLIFLVSKIKMTPVTIKCRRHIICLLCCLTVFFDFTRAEQEFRQFHFHSVIIIETVVNNSNKQPSIDQWVWLFSVMRDLRKTFFLLLLLPFPFACMRALRHDCHFTATIFLDGSLQSAEIHNNTSSNMRQLYTFLYALFLLYPLLISAVTVWRTF